MKKAYRVTALRVVVERCEVWAESEAEARKLAEGADWWVPDYDASLEVEGVEEIPTEYPSP